MCDPVADGITGMPYFCDISDKHFTWLLSVGITHLKDGPKVTERAAEDTSDVSTDKLQQNTTSAVGM